MTGIHKPYFRICRPFSDGEYLQSFKHLYLLDPQYASNRTDLIRSFKLLEKDLLEVFDFVEPSDDNRDTYSHRIYQLFLRACTEIEANCSEILFANSYPGDKKRWNMTDYTNVEKACHLSRYVAILQIWREYPCRLSPFANWEKSHTLKWYQDYNNVKHSRSTEFKSASLENTVDAVAGVFLLLFAQFHTFSFDANHLVDWYSADDESGALSYHDSIFSVQLPDTWRDNDRYNFDWPKTRDPDEPFQKFVF